MKYLLLLCSLLAFALPANAAMLTSVSDRAKTINAQLEGNNSYHAHLARELAVIAVVEKDQHDLGAAKSFIKMAEDHAGMAGAK